MAGRGIVIEIKGVKHLGEQMRAAIGERRARLRPAVEATVVEMANTARRLAPRDTSKLTESIRHEMHPTEPFGKTYVLGPLPYAVAQEFGLPPRQILPKRRKWLKWEEPGGPVFARVVNHPGVRGSFYMTRAAEAERHAYIQRVTRALQGK